MASDDSEEMPETYNGPWLRGQLLTHANYVASDGFPTLWKWERGVGTTPSKLRVNHGDGEFEDVCCKVIGIVSDDRPYLEAHGNFSLKFRSELPMHKSRLQFTLRNPGDVDFGSDFALAYKRLEAVQDKIATGNDRSWFLKNNTMRFSFPLWELKNESNSGPVENEQTESYRMRDDFTDIKLETQESYQIQIMRVARWGSEELVEASKFPNALLGALVDVTFVLRHYFIKAKASGDQDVNSYQALVQQVNILKPAPPPVRSPFQDRRKGGVLLVNQSPRKSPSKSAPLRNEQVAAVDSFGPQVSKKAAEKRKQPDTEVAALSSKKPREAAQSS